MTATDLHGRDALVCRDYEPGHNSAQYPCHECHALNGALDECECEPCLDMWDRHVALREQGAWLSGRSA